MDLVSFLPDTPDDPPHLHGELQSQASGGDPDGHILRRIKKDTCRESLTLWWVLYIERLM